MEQGYKIIEEINYRAMMGEYIIYYRDKDCRGIYDRLLAETDKICSFLYANCDL